MCQFWVAKIDLSRKNSQNMIKNVLLQNCAIFKHFFCNFGLQRKIVLQLSDFLLTCSGNFVEQQNSQNKLKTLSFVLHQNCAILERFSVKFVLQRKIVLQLSNFLLTFCSENLVEQQKLEKQTKNSVNCVASKLCYT